MTDDQGVIILGYKPGPAAGLVTVVVDAPGFRQAEMVIEERFKGTPDEARALRRMLDARRNEAEASTEVEY